MWREVVLSQNLSTLPVFNYVIRMSHNDLFHWVMVCCCVLQCQVGVLPLGTGNDLARVLGWGPIFDDDTQLPAVLEKMEHAQIKMLDR